MTDPIVVLPPYGTISLIDRMGGDLSVVGAARVSTGKDPEHSSKGPEFDERLIRFLMENGHGTPFEHAVFQFYVKAPIFVAREWFRHRIGSFNEQSGRYGTYEPEFYLPEQARVPDEGNKQRSHILPGNEIAAHMQRQMREAFEHSYRTYKDMLTDGLAREMARMVLPVSLYTSWWWTVNCRSLLNFLMLRADERAQWEIRMYAEVIEGVLKGAMPMTYAAWIAAGRRAP